MLIWGVIAFHAERFRAALIRGGFALAAALFPFLLMIAASIAISHLVNSPIGDTEDTEIFAPPPELLKEMREGRRLEE